MLALVPATAISNVGECLCSEWCEWAPGFDVNWCARAQTRIHMKRASSCASEPNSRLRRRRMRAHSGQGLHCCACDECLERGFEAPKWWDQNNFYKDRSCLVWGVEEVNDYGDVLYRSFCEVQRPM